MISSTALVRDTGMVALYVGIAVLREANVNTREGMRTRMARESVVIFLKIEPRGDSALVDEPREGNVKIMASTGVALWYS